MGATPKYGIRYPELADPADITQLKTLALDTETAIDAAVPLIVGLYGRLAGDMVTDQPTGIVFDVQTNLGGWTTDGTNFVCPVAGLYFISMTAQFADGYYGALSTLLNGAALTYTQGYVQEPGGTQCVNNVITQMSVGHSFRGQVSSQGWIRTSAFSTSLSVFMIAPL